MSNQNIWETIFNEKNINSDPIFSRLFDEYYTHNKKPDMRPCILNFRIYRKHYGSG